MTCRTFPKYMLNVYVTLNADLTVDKLRRRLWYSYENKRIAFYSDLWHEVTNIYLYYLQFRWLARHFSTFRKARRGQQEIKLFTTATFSEIVMVPSISNYTESFKIKIFVGIYEYILLKWVWLLVLGFISKRLLFFVWRHSGKLRSSIFMSVDDSDFFPLLLVIVVEAWSS